MKTIKYFTIPLLIVAIIFLAVTKTGNTKSTLLIESSDKDVTSLSLDMSAEIISKRLIDFNAGKFNISVIPAKKQIKVVFDEDPDIQTVEKLLVQKGVIEFYETYNHEGFLDLLNGNDHLFSLLAGIDSRDADAKVGCTSSQKAEEVNTYVKTLGIEQKCKFAWFQDADNSSVCLYALKFTDGIGPLIKGSDIESTVYDQDRIKIKLIGNATVKFADATKRNLDNVIAILLDDKVISAPRVRSEILSGEIEITGRFTKTEAGYMAALLNNDPLPVSFYLVR